MKQETEEPIIFSSESGNALRNPALSQTSGPAKNTLNVLQGETRISQDPNMMMTTILGSCVATCMWDPDAAVGGLNHFLLPGAADQKGDNLRYGINAMELLVNGLLKMGAHRDRLRVKMFGGAKMFDGGEQIGQKNSEFARWFMEQEGLAITSYCLGGKLGRKIRFWPATGKAQRMFMEDARQIIQIEQRDVNTRPSAQDHGGDVELF